MTRRLQGELQPFFYTEISQHELQTNFNIVRLHEHRTNYGFKGKL